MTQAVLHERTVAPPSAVADLVEQFLTVLAQSILDKMDDSLFSDCAVKSDMELADDIWTRWGRYANPAQKRGTLQSLARVTFEELDEVIERVEKAFGTSANSDLGKTLGNYFHLLPGSIRRWCRRPNLPAGTTLPDGLALDSGEDLLPFLPARLTRFQPGDRPWSAGEYELEELIEQTATSEVWKVRSLGDAAAPPVALHFFLHPTARNYVIKQGAAALQQIQQLGAVPGLVPLQAIHQHGDPPCLQYPYIQAAPLTALVEQWREAGQAAASRHVADLIEQLAQTLGHLHRRRPALVHRDLNPNHILLTPKPQGGWRSYLSHLGLGPCNGHATAGAVNPYASPEQLRDDTPRPQDDVFALGVLWYQLLVGDLTATRPGGSSWRRRLTQRGAPAELIELLEGCFDDDPRERPEDGLALAERMQNLAARSRPPSAPDNGEMSLVFNALQMAFTPIPGGTFWMGSDFAEAGRSINEYLRHEVTLSAPFYLAMTPVTQAQFASVMQGRNPAQCDANHGGGPDHPVESISCQDAEEFCRRLSALPEEEKAGRTYRLPTEAEWECACRAGTTTPYSFGLQLSPTQACFAAAAPTRVGRFAPNPFGLFDMHGNVWEWCSDIVPGNPAGSLRVLRGGSWRSSSGACRSASRHALPAAARADDVGFRVVMEMRRALTAD